MSRNPRQCFSKLCFFLRRFDVVFHMLGFIYQTFHQNKKCSWDKTGEGNVPLDLAISAQKYPKIVTQEKEKFWHVAACFCLVSMLDIPTRTWGALRTHQGGPYLLVFGHYCPVKSYDYTKIFIWYKQITRR